MRMDPPAAPQKIPANLSRPGGGFVCVPHWSAHMEIGFSTKKVSWRPLYTLCDSVAGRAWPVRLGQSSAGRQRMRRREAIIASVSAR